MTIQRYRRKPQENDHSDQLAAKYEPGRPLGDLAAVARMAHHRAELAEVTFPSGMVLLVRYTHVPDDGPPEIRYETVEPGHWLAYSRGNDFLYDATDGNWRQFYDLVPGAQP